MNALEKRIEAAGFRVMLHQKPEDLDYRGNCSAISLMADAEAEKWISDQLALDDLLRAALHDWLEQAEVGRGTLIASAKSILKK